LIETRLGTTPLLLTERECALLKVLALGGGKTFTRAELMRRAWGPDLHITPRSVDVYVGRLRRKIEIASQNSHQIETIWGIGYRLCIGRASQQGKRTGGASRSAT
jgi:DNA-binding response OmpR family regulator